MKTNLLALLAAASVVLCAPSASASDLEQLPLVKDCACPKNALQLNADRVTKLKTTYECYYSWAGGNRETCTYMRVRPGRSSLLAHANAS